MGSPVHLYGKIGSFSVEPHESDIQPMHQVVERHDDFFVRIVHRHFMPRTEQI